MPNLTHTHYTFLSPASPTTPSLSKAAYAFGKQLVPAQGKFESLFYALDLNDPTCKTEMAEEATTTAVKDERLNPVHDIK